MKKIKIKYVGWWQGFEPEKNKMHKILDKHFDIEFSEQPDYIISSVFTNDFLKYDCVRILHTGENLCPDFSLFDYAVGYEYLSFGDRYLRLPDYMMNLVYEQDVIRMLQKHLVSEEELREKNEFCSFVYSNGEADPIRRDMFCRMGNYRPVNSGGRFMNNINLPEGVPDKYEFQNKHRFSIAFENGSHPGYTTEKLVQSFASKTIPIYWGDPLVERVFNPKAMVCVKDRSGLDEAVERVRQIDLDDKLYLDMMRQPAMINAHVIEEQNAQLEKFLINIFSQPIDAAFRRNMKERLQWFYNAMWKPQTETKTTFMQKVRKHIGLIGR